MQGAKIMALQISVHFLFLGGYNRIQRNSSGRESSHLTDSGIGCNDDFSHIYSEPTEDPDAYLEPVRIHLDPNDDRYLIGGEISMIEGSVADTDYFDDFGRRCQTGINVDKYKIMPLKGYSNRVSVISDGRPVSASDFSDVDAYTLTSDGKKIRCNLEKELLSMPLSTDGIPVRGLKDSLGRKELVMLEEESPDVLIFNNLNKSSDVISREEKLIAEPNIESVCGGSLNESDQSINQVTSASSKLPSLCQMQATETSDDSNGATKITREAEMLKYWMLNQRFSKAMRSSLVSSRYVQIEQLLEQYYMTFYNSGLFWGGECVFKYHPLIPLCLKKYIMMRGGNFASSPLKMFSRSIYSSNLNILNSSTSWIICLMYWMCGPVLVCFMCCKECP